MEQITVPCQTGAIPAHKPARFTVNGQPRCDFCIETMERQSPQSDIVKVPITMVTKPEEEATTFAQKGSPVWIHGLAQRRAQGFENGVTPYGGALEIVMRKLGNRPGVLHHDTPTDTEAWTILHALRAGGYLCNDTRREVLSSDIFQVVVYEPIGDWWVLSPPESTAIYTSSPCTPEYAAELCHQWRGTPGFYQWGTPQTVPGMERYLKRRMELMMTQKSVPTPPFPADKEKNVSE